ncbi:hypothetical protein [Gordonia sp. 'Campus']|uniref:hypothetical protein n=1 Tax=Gordonia sp. 'Campus' TaxID=2915824 RepID=UPI001EE3FF0D|nr:hypothetical protein [Gordonia sp. 'Campus']
MNGEGCWSTVVCRPTERAALGLSGDSEWLLQCRLAIGHRGNHATDASTHPRHDRRLWLEWNDFDDRAQSLIERNPCPVPSPEGAGCVFFAGHGGPHFYARTNGHAPSVMTGAGAPGPQAVGPDRSLTTQHQPPTRMGTHRLPDSHQPVPLPQQQPVVEPDPQPAYRGGRRSTNAEPLVTEDYQGRRHRTDGLNTNGASADGLTADGLNAGGLNAGGPAPSGPADPEPGAPAVQALDTARLEAIGAALDEVATALARLAAVLRA